MTDGTYRALDAAAHNALLEVMNKLVREHPRMSRRDIAGRLAWHALRFAGVKVTAATEFIAFAPRTKVWC